MSSTTPSPIHESNLLVTTTIHPRVEEYYLVTESKLRDLKQRGLLSDIFVLLSSLLLGAFFSVIIARQASHNLTANADHALGIFQWVFLGAGVVCLVLTIWIYCSSRGVIKEITKCKATIDPSPT